MSLAASGETVRPSTPARAKSKVDDVLARLPEEDAATFRAWLEDPAWKAHTISKALLDYCKREGKDLTVGHATIDRWRMANGIGVNA